MNLWRRIVRATTKEIATAVEAVECDGHVWAVPDLAFFPDMETRRFTATCSNCGKVIEHSGWYWKWLRSCSGEKE